MKLRTALLFFTFSIALQCVHPQNWSRYTVLDNDDRFHLYWNPPEDKTGESKITFKVEIEAKGYFGLGFSPDGGMPGSDIVTGWMKDGKVYLQDRHAVAFSLPPKDDQQDYELIDAYENDTFTVFEFSRNLDTCDENDWIIDDSTMIIIYAYSEDDPDTDDPFYHDTNRGSKKVLLLEKIIKPDPDVNFTSLLSWDVLLPGIDFSGYDTLYWCKVYKTPEVSEKNHIVYIEPVFEKDHEQYVHHTAFYECIGDTPEEYDKLAEQRGYICGSPDMPVEMFTCSGFAVNWAVGGEATVFPEHVGWPIFPGEAQYYMMQIHYHNPELVSGIIDHSGLKMYYTPEQREFDAGNILMGTPVLPRMFIPPGQKEYVVVAHASPQCSPWAETGIKVIAVSPHAHVSSRKIKVRHFRGNQELIPLIDSRNYDFNNQAYRYFMKEVDILPGDQITVECTHDTSERSNVTFGGESTEEEMCMAFILYYPLVFRASSFSAPSFASINQVLGTNITNEADAIRDLGSYDWAKADISEIQNVMRYSEQETSCQFGPFPEEGVNPVVSYPKDLEPYESTCSVTT